MTIHFVDGTSINTVERSLAVCEAFGTLGFYATKSIENIQIIVFYTAIKYIS